MEIKHCLSIREPWASLIVARSKTIEWRSRKLIARPPETIAVATSKAGAGVFLPGGHIVGVARIVAVVPWRDERSFYERAYMLDEWDALEEQWRRHNMVTDEDRALDGSGLGGYAMMVGGFAACEPVPVRGNVGLYRVPEGFRPVYATSMDDLRRWWGGCRAWSEGPANEGEQSLMELMTQWGAGWRVDD